MPGGFGTEGTVRIPSAALLVARRLMEEDRSDEDPPGSPGRTLEDEAALEGKIQEKQRPLATLYGEIVVQVHPEKAAWNRGRSLGAAVGEGEAGCQLDPSLGHRDPQLAIASLGNRNGLQKLDLHALPEVHEIQMEEVGGARGSEQEDRLTSAAHQVDIGNPDLRTLHLAPLQRLLAVLQLLRPGYETEIQRRRTQRRRTGEQERKPTLRIALGRRRALRVAPDQGHDRDQDGKEAEEERASRHGNLRWVKPHDVVCDRAYTYQYVPVPAPSQRGSGFTRTSSSTIFSAGVGSPPHGVFFPLHPARPLIKTMGAQLALFLEEPQMRKNLGALFKYIAFLVLVTALFTVIFHVIMVWEGQDHSWLSGLYWTVVTMTTLGFGDITFETDLGRGFSMVVLISGVILLLVVLPFVFIRYFYAPWLESQIRLKAPRSAPKGLTDHVIICADDPIAPGLIEQLKIHDIHHLTLEPDPERATRLHGEGQRVLCGEIDSRDTYAAARVQDARLVFVNLEDVAATNVILTVREEAPDTPIAAIASSDDSVDLMELAGADFVIPLRRRLGEQLANRVNAGHAQTHPIGSFRNLIIAEFPVLNTPLAGKTIRETRLRDLMGVTIVAVWEHAALKPASPDLTLSDQALPVVIGTRRQLQELDELLYIYDTNWNPVIVIGGGTVGKSATEALRRKGVKVHLVERNPELAEELDALSDRLFVGSAANRELLEAAGIHDAPAVLLTTNDDAMNVFLAVYCRRLNEKLRIVSRITHERNMASIRRAGADLAMSYAGLGVATITSLARGRKMIELGEGVELFEEDLPKKLQGKTLAESGIGAETGLNVVAVERDGELHAAPRADEELSGACRLFMIGTAEQHQAFRKTYGTSEG